MVHEDNELRLIFLSRKRVNRTYFSYLPWHCSVIYIGEIITPISKHGRRVCVCVCVWCQAIDSGDVDICGERCGGASRLGIFLKTKLKKSGY